MKTITVRLESDRDAELLKNILRTTKFEDAIETSEEEDNITDEEVKMFNERVEEYRRNPSSATSLEDFKKEMKEKYGV